MILLCGIWLVFLGSVLSDEHISRQADTIIDTNGLNLPGNQDVQHPIEAKTEITNEQIKNDLPISDMKHPTVTENQADILSENVGKDIFHDSSYISFTVLVGKTNIDCYYYKARKTFDIDFQVLKGGDFDIALLIFDKNRKEVAFHKPAGDGSLKIIVPPEMINTVYSICLDNKQSSWHVKKVFVMVDVEGPNGLNHPDLQLGEYANLEKHMNKLDLMSTALTSVYESLMKVEQHQERRRLVEAIDRTIMESNFEYVTMWAVLQIVVMIVVSAVQLLLIRSLFDSRGGFGSKIWSTITQFSGGRI